jgi:hypothetical protein
VPVVGQTPTIQQGGTQQAGNQSVPQDPAKAGEIRPRGSLIKTTKTRESIVCREIIPGKALLAYPLQPADQTL